MKVKIAKWGNSLAVRLPKRLADELDLVAGRTVDLEKQGSKLTIESTAPKIPHYRLEDLLAQIKPGDKPPPLVDWGPDVGAEILPDEDWSDIAPTDEEMGIVRGDRNGSAPDAGDVLWIDFGHPLGREQGGRRPALVLTSREYNLASSVLIVCPITRTRRNWPFAVALPPLGRLTGFVLVDQIKVIDPTIRAFKREGAVPAETMLEVRARLASLLGIPVAH